ncbi:hypothetical protein CICLE_v10027354mg [Citrus x clementina]|uniref:Uncharacterized protein n=1 Tax=Citrus clementina TaxID=85681 RepID=V4SJN5_CITCL|nr:hypothetical protein CICLE_v10027354mg [Citrus x clementina]
MSLFIPGAHIISKLVDLFCVLLFLNLLTWIWLWIFIWNNFLSSLFHFFKHLSLPFAHMFNTLFLFNDTQK